MERRSQALHKRRCSVRTKVQEKLFFWSVAKICNIMINTVMSWEAAGLSPVCCLTCLTFTVTKTCPTSSYRETGWNQGSHRDRWEQRWNTHHVLLWLQKHCLCTGLLDLLVNWNCHPVSQVVDTGMKDGFIAHSWSTLYSQRKGRSRFWNYPNMGDRAGPMLTRSFGTLCQSNHYIKCKLGHYDSFTVLSRSWDHQDLTALPSQLCSMCRFPSCHENKPTKGNSHCLL